jgi:hypothetical protein
MVHRISAPKPSAAFARRQCEVGGGRGYQISAGFATRPIASCTANANTGFRGRARMVG